MIEKGIRGGKCHVIHRYAKVNNKYKKIYDKNKDSSYLMYLDASNLHGWEMSQKLSVDGFKWKNMLLSLMNTYDEDSNKRYILKLDAEYPKD